MIGAGVHLYIYTGLYADILQRGRGGELGVLKKRGRICKQCQGDHWKTMLTTSLVILRGRD